MGFIFYFVSPKQTLCLIPYPVRLSCPSSIIYNNLYPSHSSSLIYYIFCRFFYLIINANTYTIQYLSITYKTSKLRKSSFTVCPVAVHTSLSLDIVPHNRTFFTILIFIFIIFLTRTVKRIDFMKILFFQIRLKPFLSVFDFIDVFGEAEKKFALFNIIIFTFPKRDVSPIFPYLTYRL